MARIMWMIVLDLQPRQSFGIKGMRLRIERFGLIEYAYHVVDFAWKTVIFVSHRRSAPVAKMATNARRRFIHRRLATDAFDLLQRIADPDDQGRSTGLATILVVTIRDPKGPAVKMELIMPAKARALINWRFR